jgi:hypothetical protein
MSTSGITTTKFVLLLSIAFFSHSAFASELQASVAVNPVGDFTAEFKDFEGFAYQAGENYKADKFVIPWSLLKTGMALRDKHAKDYFNAKDHPNIEVLEAIGKKNGQGAARVKMNGVTKVLKGTFKVESEQLIVELPVILSQFNVKNINFKGAGVEDEVKIKVTIPVRAKK